MLRRSARKQGDNSYRKFYRNSTLLQLYLAYARPHPEYAAAVWDPHQQGHINSLERVQKLALKMCTKDWNADYDSLMEICNVPTLGYRRRYLKLCFLYSIINGHFIFPNAPIERRQLQRHLRNSDSYILQRPVVRTNAHQSSFFSHSIILWNNLPPSVQSSDSLYSFKRSLLQLTF